MRLVDGAEQLDRALGVVGQGGAAEPDAGIGQALVLTVQRQVVEEFVDQQPRQQADIGEAIVEHRSRRRHFGQACAGLVPDERAAILEHHVAARV